MGKYFTIYELSRSDKARELKINNTAPSFAVDNMNALIDNVLDAVRESYGKPIYVSSGYRCPILNQKVGGSATSDHLQGRASDLTTYSVDENKKLFTLIWDMQKQGVIEFDQLIEYPYKGYTLVHVSFREGNNRNEVLSQVGAGRYNRL